MIKTLRNFVKNTCLLRFLRELSSLKLQQPKNIFLKNDDFLNPLLTKLELSAVFEMLKIERNSRKLR